MRQSLSEKSSASSPAVLAAVVLSVALTVAAVIDQSGGQALVEHAEAAYASYGKAPSAGLLYGLLHTVAVVNVLLWLVVFGVARSKRRAAGVLAVIAVLISASVAVVLLTASEYGERIFPPLWGVLAILPAVAGAFATARLFRRAS
ncbi:hypothetical protein FB561_3646 [Kribbella amoyensis]|uniref:Uncharacterized protein n=1 Tax=Kribbella amoyensis TaxID=996641 RepID=A0A561BUP5_9ACTN|nr:hypothetical protein [Kribbella amoyensis]TWD82513.1 hypothetical protein FB561_3646 [Kribbella amoyensis]